MWYPLNVKFKERRLSNCHEYVRYVEKDHAQATKLVHHTGTRNAVGFQTFNVYAL